MTGTLTFNGRLPGVACTATLPPPPSDPLRLDVTGFVGFAERGPLDTPVLLEDIGQYALVFGHDLAVALDDGHPVYAYLPEAVRAFFDNGGRRCYAVRVAGVGAARNRFRLPGLIAWAQDGTVRPVEADAAWVGSWSDSMSVGTQLRSQPLRVIQPFEASCGQPPAGASTGAVIRVLLDVPALTTVRQGDVLRLRFGGAGMPLALLPVMAVSPCNRTGAVLRGTPVAVDMDLTAVRTFFTALDGVLSRPLTCERLTENGWELLPITGYLAALSTQEGGGYRLDIGQETSIAPGDLLRLHSSGGSVVWYPVERVDPAQADGSPPQPPQSIAVSYAPLLEAPSDVLAGQPIEVDLLSFDLAVREGEDTMESWSALRFGSGPGFWSDVLVSWPDGSDAGPPQLPAGGSSRLSKPALLQGAPSYAVLPLGMDEVPGATTWVGPQPDGQDVSSPPTLLNPRHKDGLDTFDPVVLFLDADLARMPSSDLLAQADYLRYLAPSPRRLRALHSLLAVDEVALIAIPDLAHRTWSPAQPPPVVSPSTQQQPTPPDWSHFQCCPQPVLAVGAAGKRPAGSAAISGTISPSADQLQLAQLPLLDPPAGYDPTALLAVHQAMINLAAARADLLAVLSLPDHFGQREALDWLHRLKGGPGMLDGPVLSYAAVYHPWLQYREEVTPALAPLRDVPPDGAVCGMIAAREQARGAWIAPANLPLLGVVGLTPALGSADWMVLFDNHFNLVHQQPGQFTTWSAHTLGLDPLLLQMSVRRLLIYLRKLCLRRGAQYVFESNNDRFRQRVQAAFERTLSQLVALGGLSAYIVSTGPDVNTRNDFDNGRFIVALKIAPTQPIEFITVVLLRTTEGLLQVVEA